MAEVALKAELRSGTGKGVARRLRAAGKLPAVLYGRGMEATSLAVDAREFAHLVADNGANVLIDLEVDSQTHLTLARSIDRDPLRGSYIHVDFVRIARDEVIKVDVSVHLDGNAQGVREGGVLEHHLWQLHVECLPHNVPERINVDVSPLKLGDVFHVSDVVVPEGVTILSAPEEIIVSCVMPQELKVEAEEEPVVAEGEAAPAEAGEATGGQQSPEG